MLEVNDLHAYYGKSHIIQGVTFDIADGDITGVLGRNGVGKTTLLRCILGLTPPKRSGVINFDHIEISTFPAHKIAGIGLGYIPQGRRIFPRLTVLENLMLPVTKGKVDKADLRRVFEYFPVLEERAKQLGSTLSGGEQQMLAIGRAMMSRPKLMIFDEPTEGLQPSMVLAVRESIKSLCERGITALIADQNLENALSLCDRVYVLEKGLIRYEERRENLSMELLHQYLGVAARKRERI
jgi:branched-chain amino acid transport system ATP-binding protein